MTSDPLSPPARSLRAIVWTPLSVVVHGVILLVLGIASCEELAERTAKEPIEEMALVPKRAKHLGDMLEELNRDELEAVVQSLHALRDEMQAIEQAEYQDYLPVENELASTALDDARAAQEAAMAAQEQVLLHQQGAQEDPNAQSLAMAAQAVVMEAQDRARQALSVARTPNADAAEAQARARAAQAAADTLQIRADEQRRAAETSRRESTRLEPARRNVESARDRLAREQANLDTTLAQLETARQRLQDPTKTEKQRNRKKEEQQVATAKRRVEQVRQKLDAMRATLEKEQSVLDERENAAREAEQEITETLQAARETQQEAARAQEKARSEQVQAHQALAQSDKTRPPPTPSDSEPTTAANPVETPLPPDRSLSELYEDAVAAERTIADSYHSARAAALAAIQRIPIADAKRNVDPLTVERPNLAPALQSGRDVRTAAELAAQRDVVRDALLEGSSMVGNAQRLVSLARGVREARTQGATVGQGQTQASLAQSLKELGGGERGTRVKDIAGQMKGSTAADNAAAQPPPLTSTMQPALGRKVRVEGDERADWMSVNTWYTIGPFPNPQRANINRRFGPEQFVDLDGVYEGGKDNSRLRWQYIQSSRPMVVPADVEEYAIYYAYTELSFDQATEAWIAVGSDDKSHVWINDFLVWQSGDAHKNWRIDEGFRRVHFNQGINRILYRVENGWNVCGFSLTIEVPK